MSDKLFILNNDTGLMVVDAESVPWEDVESWWDPYVDTTPFVLWPDLASITNPEVVAEEWHCVDSWWATDLESQRDALLELHAVLEAAEIAWRESSSRFDSDPLAADWVSGNTTSGPLRTHQEENWSQWFAHLIRTGPSDFSRTLFGERFDARPRSVEREVYLSAHDAPDRYADILVFYDGWGVSVEVKKGDEHYQKTTHTASLVESQFREEWNHVLLLPEKKQAALGQSFPGKLSGADAELLIVTDQMRDIEVLYWADVGRAIREVLLSETNTDPHWEASAYLFCTLIEQKLARFIPKPVIDLIIMSSDVVRTSSSVLIGRQDFDEQITYIRDTTNTIES